ncbi:HEAT repeat domain-containing protein [Corallococcus sp. 4LFB]|uniref:HEAT repeat domain-containing protein n=1 Tax=Corallococcus sp. 4LFB TaxID=3383249 RepID=UPI0039763460
MLEDPHRPSDVRSQAAAALGQRLGFEAVKTLQARLEDHDLRIREAVAQALGRLGGQQVREVLEERLPWRTSPGCVKHSSRGSPWRSPEPGAGHGGDGRPGGVLGARVGRGLPLDGRPCAPPSFFSTSMAPSSPPAAPVAAPWAWPSSSSTGGATRATASACPA